MAAKQLTAHEQKAHDSVQALLDQHAINWPGLLKILQTLLGAINTLGPILGPVLGGLGGGTTPPVTPP